MKGQQTAWRQHDIKLQTNINFYKSAVASNLFWCRVKLGPATDAASDFFGISTNVTFSTPEY